MTPAPPRSLVVRCLDWPVVAADVAQSTPAAILHANRVVATSPAARAAGVAEGLRRREAQARCPSLLVLDHDPARDARRFEPVVMAIEAVTPRIEISAPGTCVFPTRGPSRYFGGDQALADRVSALVAVELGDRGRSRVGVADGTFAALQAASVSGPGSTHLIAPGASPDFLAPLPITTLACPELTGVLVRLGLRTLGDFAALDAADVVGRFGREGEQAHRLASGVDPRPPATARPPPELGVQAELDPPAERIDAAAFVAKRLADELHDRLAGLGLSCTRVAVVAETEHGEVRERLWRHEGALTAAAMADRVRWQLDGWLHGGPTVRPSSGISLLRLVPDEVVPATGRQLGFWGEQTEATERAVRALARAQALFGTGAVTVPEVRGGRQPGDQVVLVAAETVDLCARDSRAGTETEVGRGAGAVPPWPGRLPDPVPAVIHRELIPVDVVDRDGDPVGVSGRGLATAAPARVAIPRPASQWKTVQAWAGPWPIDERWWDATAQRRRARFQVVVDDGQAHLLIVEAGRWWLEATYD